MSNISFLRLETFLTLAYLCNHNFISILVLGQHFTGPRQPDKVGSVSGIIEGWWSLGDRAAEQREWSPACR